MKRILLFLLYALAVNAYSQNVPTYVPTNGLIGWYSFNGNSNDESGNGNHPNYIGSGVTLTTDRFGQINSAYNFNGAIDSYINILSDNLPIADRTVSVWFNVPSVSNKPGILGYGGNGYCGTSFIMGLNVSNELSFHCSGHCNHNKINYYYPVEPTNEWINWVITIKNDSIKTFINGQLKQSANTINTNTHSNNANLAFGVIVSINGNTPYTDFNVNYLIGKLDDIGIWNRALTLCEIIQLYTGINYSTSSLLNIVACDSYTAPDGLIYTTSGIKSAVIPNAIGCDSTITINLTVNQSSTSSITETACNSYTAPDGAIYTTSGIKSAVIPNAAGCDSTITINLTINTVDVSVNQNGIILTANATDNFYQWLDCNNGYSIINGETSQSFIATQNGNYAVRITQNNCIDTSTCYAITTVGILENSFSNNITVYPNPTNSTVKVDLGETFPTLIVSLNDISGKLIKQFTYKNTKMFELNFNVQPGTYLLTINSGNKKATIRILKN